MSIISAQGVLIVEALLTIIICHSFLRKALLSSCGIDLLANASLSIAVSLKNLVQLVLLGYSNRQQSSCS